MTHKSLLLAVLVVTVLAAVDADLIDRVPVPIVRCRDTLKALLKKYIPAISTLIPL